MEQVAVAGGVVVLGSANADLVLDLARLPRAGETLLATGARRSPGGKGANAAVAAGRDGARCRFVGAVGDDADGTGLLEVLAGAGVDTALVRRSPQPTGLAVVLLDRAGQNAILVVPGANHDLPALGVAETAALAGAVVLLAQLELPLPVVAAGLAAARAAGVRTLLNAAPAQPLPDALWAAVDVLVVNESEAVELAAAGADPVGAARALLERVPEVVLTLGPAGARWLARGRPDLVVAAPHVPVVDTTGAGDTFCGVLAGALAGGADRETALRRAVAAASLSVQRPGAVPSVPERAATDRALVAEP